MDKKSTKVYWSMELTLRFIKMYKARPVLWDPKSKYYKNKYYRHQAFMDISGELGIHRNELERKIKNLTSHYFRERKRTDATYGCFQKPFKSKWFAFEALDFLRGKNEPWYYNSMLEPTEMVKIEMDNNYEVNKETGPPSDSGELPLKCEVFTDEESETSYENDAVEISGSLGVENKTTPVNNNTNDNNQLATNSSVPKLTLRSSLPPIYQRNADEFDLLGEEVAIKVRNLPTKYGRCFVQYKIQRLLFKAALGKYDHPTGYGDFPDVSSATTTALNAESSLEETGEQVGLSSSSNSPTREADLQSSLGTLTSKRAVDKSDSSELDDHS